MSGRGAASRFHAEMAPPWSLAAWRAAARSAWRAGIAPDAIDWDEAPTGLLAAAPLRHLPPRRGPPSVPAGFLPLAASVLCHRDPHRHALLYRMLWRLGAGERGLLARATDPDTHRAQSLARDVRRDLHKMKAFVRFRALPGHDDAFVAFFEPRHWILDRVAPFFRRRFAGMRWTIVTPYRSVRWDGASLAFGDGGHRADAPADDAQESLWRTYYAHIFNPARVKPAMMRKEMPQLYWKHLPEAALIPTLLRDAGPRTAGMIARVPVPARRRIPGRRPRDPA